MSGKSHMERWGFEVQEEDGTYRAWNTCQQGSISSFKLVPALATGEPVRQIPYLQPITIEHHRTTGQLALLCHSTGLTVFLEGRGLEALGDQLAERRVKSIHMFDAAQWPMPENDKVVVTKITVEQI